jgi:hypothetical protein
MKCNGNKAARCNVWNRKGPKKVGINIRSILFQSTLYPEEKKVNVMIKSKGKGVPWQATKAYGKVEVYYHSFLTSALSGLSSYFQVPYAPNKKMGGLNHRLNTLQMKQISCPCRE